MPGTHTLRLQHTDLADGAGTWDLISPFLPTLPNLRALELIDTPLASIPTKTISVPMGLKRFVYGSSRPEPPEYVRTTVSETRALSLFLLAHGPYLAEVALPAHLTMFSFLRGVRFGALERLHLHSYPPLALTGNSGGGAGGGAGDVAALLAAAPRLRELRVDVARPRTARAPVRLVEPSARGGNELPLTFLAALEVLVLRRPDAGERVFASLPKQLRALDLRAYPRPHDFRPTEHIAVPPISSAQLCNMLQLATSGLPGLSTLRLAVVAPFDEELVQTVVRVCPSLEVLEIQEVRQQDVAVDTFSRTVT
jgi:hypothetical protein